MRPAAEPRLNTVKRYARIGEPAQMRRAPQYRPTLVDPYREYLRKRRAADPAVPVLQLLGEIRGRGYTGSQNLLYRYIAQGRVEDDRPALSPRCGTTSPPRWRRSRIWTAADTLELLAKAPARLTIVQISAALKSAHRKNVADKAAVIQAALRADHLGRPEVITAAYAASVRALIAVLNVLNTQVKTMQGQIEAHFLQHPAAEIIVSRPGLGVILGARVLAEFGDDPDRYATAKARKNYAGTFPDHPSVREEEGRLGPVRPQRRAHRRLDGPGVHHPAALARRPRLPRPATSRRLRPQRRPPPARQPPRRHPARVPDDRHSLKRDDRLAAAHKLTYSLTSTHLGCLSCRDDHARPAVLLRTRRARHPPGACPGCDRESDRRLGHPAGACQTR
jgi:hypothetical protein